MESSPGVILFKLSAAKTHCDHFYKEWNVKTNDSMLQMKNAQASMPKHIDPGWGVMSGGSLLLSALGATTRDRLRDLAMFRRDPRHKRP